MKIIDLNTGLAKLMHAFRDLKDRWGEAKEHWNDDVSRDFETSHLQPILPHLQLLSASAQRLLEVVAKAERECEDRPESS
jgi:hypothetical protein